MQDQSVKSILNYDYDTTNFEEKLISQIKKSMPPDDILSKYNEIAEKTLYVSKINNTNFNVSFITHKLLCNTKNEIETNVLNFLILSLNQYRNNNTEKYSIALNLNFVTFYLKNRSLTIKKEINIYQEEYNSLKTNGKQFILSFSRVLNTNGNKVIKS
jgi:hypothetical protein